MIKMIQWQQDVLTLTGGMWDSSKSDAICYVVEKTENHTLLRLQPSTIRINIMKRAGWWD